MAPLALAYDVPLAGKITEAKDIIGNNFGDDYFLANYTQLSACLKQWEKESPRIKIVSIGTTEEGRPQYMAIITSPENQKHLARYKQISHDLALAQGISIEQATAMSIEGKPVIWIDGGLHATETVNWMTLGRQVYEMASRNDAETLRFLNDNVLLMPCPNPDGDELVANWYMREKDPSKRTFATLPRLYNKYVGHDNNRDSMMDNMKETTNQNRVLFVEWMPQIMHNVHQSGPAGAVIFIPPFRDPFNYNVDPLITIGIEQVGTMMHERLIARGMGGSAMRTEAPYSTWWNGGMRTACYFHNEIGILTEIIGEPTPMRVPLIADQELPTGDLPLPVAPQLWHYSRSLDYMIQVQRAIMDYASRNHDKLLYNMYVMASRNIAKGSEDYWTITPKRIAALKAAAEAIKGEVDPRAQGQRPTVEGAAPRMPIPERLFAEVLHDPKFRDPRGFIIPSDQDDFPTAVKYVDVLQKQGITVLKATETFDVAGKHYPAGSYVVKAAQAYRPEIMDFFQPQDHPMDFAYPGGPPKRPYDITGWTIAVQMGIKFDRVYDGFDGPFTALPVLPLEKPPIVAIAGDTASPAGYLISHKINDSFIIMNRLLKDGDDVYWTIDEQTVNGKGLGTGTMWIPASAKAKAILEKGGQELGVPVFAMAQKPSGAMVKMKPIKIGLIDLYGGNMPSGWLRWMLEKYEFPFEVVFPQVLDAGNLKASFDVLVFPSDTYTAGARGRQRDSVNPATLPEEFRSMLGRVTIEKSLPPLKTFVEDGGTVLALGSSATIGEAMGIPVTDHLVVKDAEGKPVLGEDGKAEKLPGSKYYIPGSVLEVAFNTKDPLAYGMPARNFIFFDSDPVFDRKEDSSVKASKVAWFDMDKPLYSGWAVGQNYLKGGELCTDCQIGKGHLVLIGFEATFRATPHAMFKLFFNGLYIGSGTPATAADLSMASNPN
jgi:hypothetical protein